MSDDEGTTQRRRRQRCNEFNYSVISQSESQWVTLLGEAQVGVHRHGSKRADEPGLGEGARSVRKLRKGEGERRAGEGGSR